MSAPRDSDDAAPPPDPDGPAPVDPFAQQSSGPPQPHSAPPVPPQQPPVSPFAPQGPAPIPPQPPTSAPPHQQAGPPVSGAPGPYGGPVMPQPRRRSRAGVVVGLIAIVVVVIASAVATLSLITVEPAEPPCSVGTGSGDYACIDPSNDESSNPLAADDAVDLTEGADPFEPTDEYATITDEEDVWIPVLGDPWEATPEEELSSARLAYRIQNEDGSRLASVSCYTAADRGIEIADFTDDQAVFESLDASRRDVFGPEAEYELAGEPGFAHYLIDGHAATAAEVDYQWTKAADESGGQHDVDRVERWGYLVIERGEADPVICSYGEWLESADADPVYRQEAAEAVLGIRLTE